MWTAGGMGYRSFCEKWRFGKLWVMNLKEYITSRYKDVNRVDLWSRNSNLKEIFKYKRYTCLIWVKCIQIKQVTWEDWWNLFPTSENILQTTLTVSLILSGSSSLTQNTSQINSISCNPLGIAWKVSACGFWKKTLDSSATQHSGWLLCPSICILIRMKDYWTTVRICIPFPVFWWRLTRKIEPLIKVR